MDKDPFFASAGKGKRRARKPTKYRSKREKRAEVLGNEDEMVDSDASIPSDVEEEEEVVNESAAERRLRLAKDVIKEIEEQEREKELDGDLLNAAIAHRLRDEVDKEKGVLRRDLAAGLKGFKIDDASIVRTRSHRLAVTSTAVSHDSAYIATASKDGSIIKWSSSGVKLYVWRRRTKTVPNGHKGQVLCLALDTTDNYLASGGSDNTIHIWNFSTHDHLKYFRGHRAAVNSLAFRKNSLMLYSASSDRTVKVWNVDALTYVETLYGHQDAVLSIDSLHRERALSCGGRDRSLRLWKIVEESQLVYIGKGTSMDCVAMISEYQYVSGNQNGSLSLWDMNKKKAVCSKGGAHGAGHWISALAAVPYGDIFASGSNDGFVRVWGIGDKKHPVIQALFAIPEQGWINDLSFTPDGSVLAAAVGKEHRLGRWDVMASGKNGGRVYHLTHDSDDEEDGDVGAEDANGSFDAADDEQAEAEDSDNIDDSTDESVDQSVAVAQQGLPDDSNSDANSEDDDDDLIEDDDEDDD